MTRDPDTDRPIKDYWFGKGPARDIATTAKDGLTAECLWTASQSTGDCNPHQRSVAFQSRAWAVKLNLLI